MSNRKPTLQQLGKVDDPKAKSRGGSFLLLLGRSYEEDTRAIFNFDPDTVFYNRAQVKQSEARGLLEYETSFHFSRWIK